MVHTEDTKPQSRWEVLCEPWTSWAARTNMWEYTGVHIKATKVQFSQTSFLPISQQLTLLSVCSSWFSLGSHPQSYHVWYVGNADTFGWESWTTCTNIWAVSSQGWTLPLCCPSKEQGTTNATSHQVHFLWNCCHGDPHFSSHTCTKSNPKNCGCTYWVPFWCLNLVALWLQWACTGSSAWTIFNEWPVPHFYWLSHDYYSGAGKKLSHCSSPVENSELLAAGKAQVCRSPRTGSTYSRVMNQSGTIHLEQDQNNCPTCSASCKSICIMVHHWKGCNGSEEHYAVLCAQVDYLFGKHNRG